MDLNEMPTAIDMAEAELRRLGLGYARVRELGGVGCLDLPSHEAFGLTVEPLRSEVLRAMQGAGFARVALFIDGETFG